MLDPCSISTAPVVARLSPQKKWQGQKASLPALEAWARVSLEHMTIREQSVYFLWGVVRPWGGGDGGGELGT
jgi:hypothetical protein